MSTTENKTDSVTEQKVGVPENIVILSVVSPNQGRIFKLHKERIVIGSIVSADVQLTGEGVSPIHAVIEVSADGVTAYDIASDSGVFVNDTKIVTQDIRTGDELTIGNFKLKFAIESVASAEKILPRNRYQDSGTQQLFVNPSEDLAPLLLEDSADILEIFDFKATQKPALEVVMSWHNTILDVEHFVKETEVTVGHERKNDFWIPPLLSTTRFSLVTRSGEDFMLNLDSKMRGVIQTKGNLRRLPDPKGSQVVHLGKNDFAKVTVGEIDFYLSHTSAPPRLKRRKLFERDAFFVKILASSLALTGLLVTSLMKANVPQSIEAEQLPDRIAKILYQPEKYSYQKPEVRTPVKEVVEEVKPPEVKVAPVPTVTKLDINPSNSHVEKPIPKVMDVAKQEDKAHKSGGKKASTHKQGEAKEGQGARASGKEGTRGQKNAAESKDHQEIAKRASPQGGAGNGGGASQVEDQGNVDLLKGASSKIQNLLGDTAAQLGKGGEKLQGFGAFSTMGKGGAALAGDGKGGGGDAASLGGLSDKGRGGGRVGTGLGAAGNGGGIIGGKTRVSIHTGGPEEAVVMGSIDASAVEAALLAHRDEFRLCYEREINAETPNISGRVGTSFVIGTSGRVNQAGIESTSLKNVNVERCILTVIKRIDFPIPLGGGIVQVTYPFKFSAGR